MLHPGLYEQVINNALTGELAEIPEARKSVAPIDKAEASKVLAQYLADVVQKGLDNVLDNGGDISAQIGLTNQIVDLIQNTTKEADFAALGVDRRAEQLLALLREADPRLAVGKTAADIERPETSIAQSSLFTGAVHEPQMFTELKKEIVSADRIDMLVSFIKWSGLRLIMDELREFTQNGGELRIITTSYMGATDVKAIEELRRTTVLIVETEYAQPLGRRIVYKSHLLIPFTVHNILAYKPFHNLSHPSRKGYNRLHLLMQLPPTTALNLLQVLGQIIYVRYAMLFHIARYSTQRVHVRGNKQRSVTLPSVHGIPQINNDLRVRIQEEVRSVHLQRSVIPTMAFNPIDLQISDDAGRLSEIHTSRPLAMWHMYLNRVVLLQPLFLLQYIACSKNISFTSERLYRLLVEGGIGIGKSTMRSYIFANHFLRFYEIFSVYPVANRFPMLLSNAFLIDSLKSVADGVASNKIVSMRGLKLHSR